MQICRPGFASPFMHRHVAERLAQPLLQINWQSTSFQQNSGGVSWALLHYMRFTGTGAETDLKGILCVQDAPHGVIDLSQCLTVKSANDKTGKSFSFEVATPDQVYFMCASDEATKDDWIGAIGRAIVRYSASYTKNTGPGPQVAIEQDDDVSSDED